MFSHRKIEPVILEYEFLLSLRPPSRVSHSILVLWFLLLFSSPILNGWRLDVYHVSTHGVALVRIKNASLKCAARGSLKIQDTKLSNYIFATKACIDNLKKLLNSNISSTELDMGWMHPWIGLDWIGSNAGKTLMDWIGLDWIAANG